MEIAGPPSNHCGARMLEVIAAVAACIPFYLIGALPTGYLVARFHGVDIASSGSGNVGATNVARVIGKKAGLITLGIDVLKGLLSVSLASFVFGNPELTSLAAVATVGGHCFSIPGRSKGGKGVATGMGVLLVLSPVSAICAVAVFSLIFGLSKIVSLSSISAALCAPLFASLTGIEGSSLYSIGFVALLICYRHKENLRRLSEGNEKKFSFGEKRPQAGA